jgi:hypothetical protein
MGSPWGWCSLASGIVPSNTFSNYVFEVKIVQFIFNTRNRFIAMYICLRRTVLHMLLSCYKCIIGTLPCSVSGLHECN